MNDSYCLATARYQQKQCIFVKHDQLLYQFSDLLLEQDMAQLYGQLPDDLMTLFESWDYWREVLPGRIESQITKQSKGISPDDVAFCPPLLQPKKLICIGSNYRDHIEEMKIPMLPKYPYSFLKPASTTLRGSGENVSIPATSKMVDWEAELAVIIGQHARNVAKTEALNFVAGYSNLNDISARDCIENRPAVGIDWVLHKCYDGFAPMGPYFLPAEFVVDPQALPIELTVNGVVKQSSSTEQMVFGVAEIIEHLSSIMTLEPGDVIATGTPAGVGHGRNPQEFLKKGDVIEMQIGELGVLKTIMQ